MLFFLFIAISCFAYGITALKCNGHEEFCDRPYNKITYLATHNSYAYAKNIGSNQEYPISYQLDEGVRALKLTTAKPGSWSNSSQYNVQLCHTMCEILDAGPLEDTLNIVANWLKLNPHEVVTIMMNNIGDFHSRDLEPVFEASDIMPYLYIKQRYTNQWPTLGEMIESDKRLVVFFDVGADPSEVAWINHQFEYMWETPYNNFSPEDFNCEIDRPGDPKEPDEMMYLVNHFLYGNFVVGNMKIPLPQGGKAADTNSRAQLQEHMSKCAAVLGRNPSFIEVDFFDQGDAITVVDELNNVSHVRREQSNDQTRVIRISTNAGVVLEHLIACRLVSGLIVGWLLLSP